MPTNENNVRRIVRLRAKAGTAPRMREALIHLQADTTREPGCREFEFLQSLTQAEAFLLIEDFDSAAALEAHMQAQHTKDFFALGVLESGAPVEKAWLS